MDLPSDWIFYAEVFACFSRRPPSAWASAAVSESFLKNVESGFYSISIMCIENTHRRDELTVAVKNYLFFKAVLVMGDTYHATCGHFPVLETVMAPYRRSTVTWKAWGRPSASRPTTEQSRMWTLCHNQVELEVLGAKWYLFTRRLTSLQLPREGVHCSRTDCSLWKDGSVLWIVAGHAEGPWNAYKGLCGEWWSWWAQREALC